MQILPKFEPLQLTHFPADTVLLEHTGDFNICQSTEPRPQNAESARCIYRDRDKQSRLFALKEYCACTDGIEKQRAMGAGALLAAIKSGCRAVVLTKQPSCCMTAGPPCDLGT
jgi:hypothetical protein